MFGTSPSPAVATYGLRRLRESLALMSDNSYVDEGLQSLLSPEEAIDLLERTQKALSTA